MSNKIYRLAADGSTWVKVIDGDDYVLDSTYTSEQGVQDTNISNLQTDLSTAETAIINNAPTGFIGMYGGGAVSLTGWLFCDGSAVSRTTYADLFAEIDVDWGSGDGSTTFNLPNFVDRFARGANTVGGTGGSADAIVVTHSHTMNAHDHTINHGHADTLTAPAHTHTVNHDHATNNTGARGTAYNNTANYAGLNGLSGGPYAIPSHFQATGSHTHTLNAAAFNGNSGNASATALTGGVTDFGGASEDVNPGDTNDAGASGVGANLPPYSGVRFIIKT